MYTKGPPSQGSRALIMPTYGQVVNAVDSTCATAALKDMQAAVHPVTYQ